MNALDDLAMLVEIIRRESAPRRLSRAELGALLVDLAEWSADDARPYPIPRWLERFMSRGRPLPPKEERGQAGQRA